MPTRISLPLRLPLSLSASALTSHNVRHGVGQQFRDLDWFGPDDGRLVGVPVGLHQQLHELLVEGEGLEAQGKQRARAGKRTWAEGARM